MTEKQIDLVQGTLHLLILKALALGEMHGLGISRRIEQLTKGTFQVKPGSLFPALQRMKDKGWIASSLGKSETNRDAKYYRLTKRQETTGERDCAVGTGLRRHGLGLASGMRHERGTTI